LTEACLVKVLNSGHVRLVDSLGSDLSIVRAARVSYNAEWRSGLEERSDNRLIRYLLRNGHTSPFEHVSFTFDVKAPIFVLRQWHRHRTWRFSEVSGRYTELPEEYYIPELDKITTQSSDNKQMRTREQHPRAFHLREVMRFSMSTTFNCYRELLQDGCPRELARMVLPLNTYSHMFATVDLHNLMHFLKLRLHEHAQYEIRVYAEAMLSLIEPIVPVSIAAWKEINNELFSNRHGGSDVQ
jgi:thymidylate synthase (FAD)